MSETLQYPIEIHRIFHYTADDGEPAEIHVKAKAQAELIIDSRFGKPKKKGSRVTVHSPRSGEEIVISLDKALDQTYKKTVTDLTTKQEKMIIERSVRERVAAQAINTFLRKEVSEKILEKKIGFPTAFRKLHVIQRHEEEYDTMISEAEGAGEVWDPVTDEKLSGIKVRFQLTEPEENPPEFPRLRELPQLLGLKSDYDRNVILRATGNSAAKFMQLWEDSAQGVKALEEFEQTEEARLETLKAESRRDVEEVISDLIAVLKESVRKRLREHWAWMDSQLDTIWRTQFPGEGLPTAWSYEEGD